MDEQGHLSLPLVEPRSNVVPSLRLRTAILSYRVLRSIGNFMCQGSEKTSIDPRYLATSQRQSLLTAKMGGRISVRRTVERKAKWTYYRLVRRSILARKSGEPHCVAINERADRVWSKEYEVHPELFLAGIPQGRILGPSGVVITPDKRIVEESAWVGDGWLEQD